MNLKQYLIEYSNEVINNEIISCQKHKWACQRFLRDIARENTDEFPYIFDENKALRFLKWMTIFKHTKGVLQGQYIEPHPIQIFVFGNIYGWVNRETHYRRFKKAYWQVARKNAKSQSLAFVGSYESSALGEGMSEVYIGATKKEQAEIVYNETVAIINACKQLKEKFKVAYGRITHLKTQSIIRALTKEDKKTGDGLSPQCAIIDEYHAHETDEIYNVLDSGMVARPQPLLMTITTAGSNTNSPCYRLEYQYVSKLLNPDIPVENEQYFAMVNELEKDNDGNLIDDIEDENNWIKANPIAASYPVGLENLRAKLTQALEIPEKMDDFLTKNMNVWINKRENTYMQMDKWSKCGVDILPELAGKACYIGADLSARIDLASVGFVFPLGGNKYVIKSHSFIPEATLIAKSHSDKVPYRLWVEQGWITVTNGSAVDYAHIKKYILDEVRKNNWHIKEFCFDEWNAIQFGQDMANEGFETVEINQGIKRLSEPTKHFREMTYECNIIHEKNPVLSWAVSNAVAIKDPNENIKLDKAKSTERIDPIAAVLNGYARAFLLPEKSSVYEERGIRTL